MEETDCSPLLMAMDGLKEALQNFVEQGCKRNSSEQPIVLEKLKDVRFRCFLRLTEYEMQVSKKFSSSSPLCNAAYNLVKVKKIFCYEYLWKIST